MSKTYTLNLETNRLELTGLSKEDYNNLEATLKSEVKRYFLFSRTAGTWCSKSTKNHNMAKFIAKKLGLTEKVELGERLSEKEMIEKKIRSAEKRIAGYTRCAEKARKRAAEKQAEFNKNRGDISWLTQPNVNSSAGRAFTNSRNRALERYRKGFEELDKAKYFEGKVKSSESTLRNSEKITSHSQAAASR